jgi:hypothetical protein
MPEKKKSSSTVNMSEAVIATSGQGETTAIPGQPGETDIHTREKVVVADNPPPTLGTSADDTAADVRKTSKVELNEFSTS